VYDGLILLLLDVLGWAAPWGDSLVNIILPSMLVNTLAMPLAYLLVRTLDRSIGRSEITW